MDSKAKKVRARVDKELAAFRAKLAKEIKRIIEERELTQVEASYIIGDAPSQVSLVTSGKLRGFSTDRLLRMRVMLGAEVEVVVVSSTASSIGATFR